jgi:hypothetical protein
MARACAHRFLCHNDQSAVLMHISHHNHAKYALYQVRNMAQNNAPLPEFFDGG